MKVAILDSPLVIGWSRTGSRFICDPPPTDTDDDRVVLVKDLLSFHESAINAGFELSNSYGPQDHNSNATFFSYRGPDDLNLIVTADARFYFKFYRATEICRYFNVKEKGRRIDIFRFMLYDEDLN